MSRPRHAAGMLALVSFVSTALAATPETPERFAWRARVEASADAPFLRVALPVEAALAAREPGLRDLRVFNAAGESLPFAVIDTPVAPAAARSTPASAFPLRAASPAADATWKLEVRRDTAGSVVAVEQHGDAKQAPVRAYLIDTGSEPGARLALSVALAAPSEEVQRLRVEASEDLQQWRTVQDEAALAWLQSAGQEVRRERIVLGGVDARYLRLSWRAPAEAPALGEVRIERQQAGTPAALAWSAPLPLRRTAEGEYRLDLPTGIAARELRLPLAKAGAEARALLTVRADIRDSERDRWQSIGAQTLYRIQDREQTLSQEALTLPGYSFRQLRLRVDTASAAMLGETPAVQLGLAPRQLVFLARGQKPYSVAIGLAGTPAQAVSIERLVPGFGSTKAPRIADASLSESAPRVGDAADAAADTSRKWILWVVLIAAVGAMAAMAFSLLRGKASK
ncbi:DUF3999 family protein [Niveibacterium sp. SC-1]|uniref:DUF3999 family protein n=1 Tax=Niveibacterium sp. SC-1 TaxID=3135646 RepID=UPI00311F8BFE